jgi:hypothetical protein
MFPKLAELQIRAGLVWKTWCVCCVYHTPHTTFSFPSPFYSSFSDLELQKTKRKKHTEITTGYGVFHNVITMCLLPVFKRFVAARPDFARHLGAVRARIGRGGSGGRP